MRGLRERGCDPAHLLARLAARAALVVRFHGGVRVTLGGSRARPCTPRDVRGADVFELRRPRIERRAREEVVRTVLCAPALGMLPGGCCVACRRGMRTSMQRIVPALERHTACPQRDSNPERHVLRRARGRAPAAPGAEVGVQRDGVDVGGCVVVPVPPAVVPEFTELDCASASSPASSSGRARRTDSGSHHHGADEERVI
ncbi:hypothetical protein DFH08DRAFT_974714 [Mycena albidolilacea]|uniref:Uncharacterized protein n=1 Tax=Mycena albidolilacea TaxID=1033008 RepID=A0AAD6Z6V1_9AGAR|nr:hypothetical protein DFH08DRAFT_974714 [Mycena albidolilacea]